MSEYLLIVFTVASFIPLSIIILSENSTFKNYQKFFFPALIILSLIPKLYFLYNESYYMQGLYDIPGHIDYIKYVATHFSLPKPYDCWECSQQPIYYLTASFLYKFAQIVGIISEQNLIQILQLYSFFLFYLFLFIAVAIFKLVLNPKQALIATSLILFWPAGAIHSARVGNDPLLYVILSLSLYFLIQWWIKKSNHSLIKSIFFILLGLLTKTNALIMIPIITLSYLIKVRGAKKLILFFLVLLFLVTTTMILNQRNNLFGNKQDTWLIGNWNGIPKSSYIGNKLENFISFDLKSYIQYPNISPSSDLGGRQYFWIYLIKTSLFGELSIEHPIQQNLAKIISILILGLIICLIVGLLKFKKLEFKLYVPILLSIFFFLSSISIYRIYFPCPCTNDFRFIYPSLIPILILIALSSEFFAKNQITKYTYIIFIGYYISLSFLYHIIPYITS